MLSTAASAVADDRPPSLQSVAAAAPTEGFSVSMQFATSDENSLPTKSDVSYQLTQMKRCFHPHGECQLIFKHNDD